MSEKLTQTRANLLRLVAYSDVKLNRNGALEPSYQEGRRWCSGHEANGFEWLLDNGYVRTLEHTIHNLPVGELRPTPKGRAWLEANKGR